MNRTIVVLALLSVLGSAAAQAPNVVELPAVSAFVAHPNHCEWFDGGSASITWDAATASTGDAWAAAVQAIASTESTSQSGAARILTGACREELARRRAAARTPHG